MLGKVEYGSFFDFERRYKAELLEGDEDRRDHVFHTSFETLKANPKKEIAELGRCLGVERSDDFYDQVVEATSFQKIKELRDQDHRYPWHK